GSPRCRWRATRSSGASLPLLSCRSRRAQSPSSRTRAPRRDAHRASSPSARTRSGPTTLRGLPASSTNPTHFRCRPDRCVPSQVLAWAPVEERASSCLSWVGPPSARLLLPGERLGESVEACLPSASRRGEPNLKLVETFGPKRVEALRSVRPDPYEPRLVQDAQMPRDTRLVDAHSGHDVVHRLLAPLKRLDNQATRGVGQRLEEVGMHHGGYVYSCILRLSSLLQFFLWSQQWGQSENGAAPFVAPARQWPARTDQPIVVRR